MALATQQRDSHTTKLVMGGKIYKNNKPRLSSTRIIMKSRVDLRFKIVIRSKLAIKLKHLQMHQYITYQHLINLMQSNLVGRCLKRLKNQERGALVQSTWSNAIKILYNPQKLKIHNLFKLLLLILLLKVVLQKKAVAHLFKVLVLFLA